MLGSLIGAGIGAVGSIFGGIKASKAMKKVKRDLNDQRSENESWYDRRYNEDATQRSDAVALLTKVEDSIRSRNRQLAGTQAVMGGTAEAAAAEREANNAALAQTATNIAVNGEARKDAIESQYRQTDANLRGQLNNMEMGKAQAIAQATQGVTQAAGAVGGLYDDYSAERKKV